MTDSTRQFERDRLFKKWGQFKLHECFECIKADRKIATAILLRACVEIFIDVGGFKKAYTLGSNIEALIPLMGHN